MGFFKRRRKATRPVYLILDRDSHVLAKCERVDKENDENPRFRVQEGNNLKKIAISEIAQAVPSGDAENGESIIGRVASYQGGIIILEPLRESGSALRRHFRVPVMFESYIYYPGGGRDAIVSADLSCGGVAFYMKNLDNNNVINNKLNVHDVIEIAIPVTMPEPLLVSCDILRSMPYQENILKFAGQFQDMIHDQEAMIQEAVFKIQMDAIWAARQAD